MNSTLSATNELLPGYVITERIGSGGYGEVFRAIAPGGIEKAVKSLYGYHDEELASRELKALERIKLLRHPFLLSLDRFEVVDGRLIVVTELADGSLDDCFQACRQEGKTGIPRDELLSYLRDAADALDYMQDEFGLQHLDVKPENLLVVGAHVKVADFGLVKDVAKASQCSQVGGMTPTYAAPELFDNRPGPRTDQYSLAIVFQELLTGTLPFPGRTAAQLVAQHTQSEPRVAALPSHDQPVIRRALSKKPQDRFSNCKELIEALLRAERGPQQEPPRPQNDSARQEKNLPSDDTKGSSSYLTEPLRQQKVEQNQTEAVDSASSTDQTSREQVPDSARRWGATDCMPASVAEWNGMPPTDSERVASHKATQQAPQVTASTTVTEVAAPSVTETESSIRPTLLIGLGGQGAEVLQSVQRNLLAVSPETDWRQLVPMIALDTDRNALRSAAGLSGAESMAAIETMLMPLRLPQHYRSQSSTILQWLSRRWFYNIPRTLKTDGYRPLGRLALVDNAEAATSCIAELMERVTDQEQLESLTMPSGMTCVCDKPRVIIVSSTSGGTGSGVALDLAWAIRNLADVQETSSLKILGLFGDCCDGNGDARDLSFVNTLAFLREYCSIDRQGNRSEESQHEQSKLFEGDGLPFNHTYFLSSFGKESRISVEEWISQAAQYLSTDISSGCGPILDACRVELSDEVEKNKKSNLVRSFVVAPLSERQDVVTHRAREVLCRMVAKHWRRRTENANGSRIFGELSELSRAKVEALPSSPVDGEQEEKRCEEELVECLRVATRKEFGAAAESVFVAQLAQELEDNLKWIVNKLHKDSDLASDYYLHRIVHHAFEELTDIVCQYAAEAPDGEVMSARCLKSTEHSEALLDMTASNDQVDATVEEIARKASKGFFQALLKAEKPSETDIREFLLQAVDRTLEEVHSREEGVQLIDHLAGCHTNVSLIAEKAVIGPLGCGHKRCSIVVIPESGIENRLEEEIRSQFSTALIVNGKVSCPILIREASQLSLPQIASQMCEDRPELVEASRRLQTRNDIAWLPLPQIVLQESE